MVCFRMKISICIIIKVIKHYIIRDENEWRDEDKDIPYRLAYTYVLISDEGGF